VNDVHFSSAILLDVCMGMGIPVRMGFPYDGNWIGFQATNGNGTKVKVRFICEKGPQVTDTPHKQYHNNHKKCTDDKDEQAYNASYKTTQIKGMGMVQIM